jgi:hypothetical protein
MNILHIGCSPRPELHSHQLSAAVPVRQEAESAVSGPNDITDDCRSYASSVHRERTTP